MYFLTIEITILLRSNFTRVVKRSWMKIKEKNSGYLLKLIITLDKWFKERKRFYIILFLWNYLFPVLYCFFITICNSWTSDFYLIIECTSSNLDLEIISIEFEINSNSILISYISLDNEISILKKKISLFE